MIRDIYNTYNEGIALLPQQYIKVGRQTNATTVPAEHNGYFDSKVLSRQHAEVWEQDGRRRSNREVGRPQTPKPLAESYDDDYHRSKPRSHIPDDIIRHLETLSSRPESAVELSRSLQAQQASAQNTIQLLEHKVTKLQQLVQATQMKVDDQQRHARDKWELKTKTIKDGILAHVESSLSLT